jgi:hypothetical protein
MSPFTLEDWRSGAFPEKGWDVADAIADGWTLADIFTFMKDMVSDDLPDDEPLPAAKALPPAPVKAPAPVAASAPVTALAPAPAPVKKAPVRMGVDGVKSIAAFSPVQVGDDVELAKVLALRLVEACEGQVVFADGTFWAWGPTEWRKIEDRLMRMACHGFSGIGVGGKGTGLAISATKIDGIIRETGTVLGNSRFFDNPTVALNAANAVITIDPAGVVRTRPHDPDDRFRFTIPADFNLNTDMIPPPGSMLHTLLEGAFRDDPDAADKMWLVAEILGAAAFGLATRMPQPKAFVLHGESANNGKSTIASLISCLLPEGAVSAIKPAQFADDARVVNLAGKAANVADEISGAVAGEVFKAAITGNTLEGRDLYRSAMTFVPRAIHVFTTNKLPTFNGGLDRGLQRRLVVLVFNRPIPLDEVIVDIVDRIKRDELDMLLGFAIAGAIRLFRNKAYTIPASSNDALRSWLLLDPIHEWFDAKCKPAHEEPLGGWPTLKALFADFKAWAVDQGHNERSLPHVSTFSQRMRTMPGVMFVRRSSGSIAKGITCAFTGGF